MPPFATDALSAADNFSIHDHPAADPGAQDDAENHPRLREMLLNSAHAGFCHCKTVGVIGHFQRNAEDGFQILFQRLVVEAEGIAVFQELRLRIQRAWRSDTDPRGRQIGSCRKLVN